MAIVKHIQARPTTFGGHAHSGWLPRGVPEPLPTAVNIVPTDFQIEEDSPASYVLAWYGPSQEFCGDVWQASLEDALESAEAWFGVQSSEWIDGGPTDGS